MSRIMSLLLLVGPLWKNCTVTQNSWLKRKVGLFVLLVLSFDLCSLSPVVCLRSLTIYNVHISFVLLISNSVYTIQLSRASRDSLQQPIRVWEKLSCDQSEFRMLERLPNILSPEFTSRGPLSEKQTTTLNSNSTFSCCCLK